LVFFKTSRQDRHVGIYIGDDQFIHASRKKGVITSSMNNTYWVTRYETSVRVIG
jgi:lipoprotein Spr